LTAKTDELLQHKQDLEETMATRQQRLAALREQEVVQEGQRLAVSLLLVIVVIGFDNFGRFEM
jgi:hypothetical protein